MRLLDLPHREMRELLARGAVVSVGVNPVEYHGPHLPLHTDSLISVGLDERVEAARPAFLRGLPLLQVEDLELGVEPVPGPGSRPTSFQDLRRALIATVEGLLGLGVGRIWFRTFHGAPLHNAAIHDAIVYAARRGARAVCPFVEVVRQTLEVGLPPFAAAWDTIPDETLRNHLRDDRMVDFHGGFFETSVLMALRPEAVGAVHKALPDCPEIPQVAAFKALSGLARRLGRGELAKELRFASIGAGWETIRPFPGYTGSPSAANPEAGRIFVEHIVERYLALGEAVLDRGEPAPAPILGWVRALTLGGRLGAAKPGLHEMARHGAGDGR